VLACSRGDLRGLQADVQAQLGIGRGRLGGVLTSLAGARKRLPRVDYPIERDKDLRRHRVAPVAAEFLLGAVERARVGTGCRVRLGRCLDCRPDSHGSIGRLEDQSGVDLGA
jgi:hypothetical protein